MEFKAKEIAEILKGTVEGNPEATVSTFARIENGKPGSICFFANPKYEHYVYQCKADIIIVNNSFVPQQPVSATMIRVENAYASVAELLDYVTAKKRSYRRYRGRHVRRFFSSKIGKKVYIGDCSYIGRNAVIGDYTKIHEQVYVGDGTKIGRHCIIYPGVKIYSGMEIGDNVIVDKPPEGSEERWFDDTPTYQPFIGYITTCSSCPIVIRSPTGDRDSRHRHIGNRMVLVKNVDLLVSKSDSSPYQRNL